MPEVFRPDLLPFHPDVGAEIDDSANEPANQHSETAAQQSHGSSFVEEDALDVAIAGADGLHNPNFAAALQDRHNHRTNNAQRCYRQCEAAEDSEKKVKNLKKPGNIF